ncbi:hypothetical protein ACSBR2_031306 [Camellia fascicularis]
MEDTELEEGEACYYRDDTSVDPDIALSYLDEKLHSVLGHFQKDFEGGVSAENLGAKFGGYGSFLPTYQRSPSVRPQSKTPQRVQNFSSPRSPDVLPIECAPQNSTAPSDAAQSLRLNTASRSLNKLHTARASSGDISAKQNSCLSSAVVIEKFPMKHEPVSIKPVNPTDQRTLKVRIKVGSDNRARKNAAIYSGLGLISPTSSMGNSPDESGGMSSECQGNVDESLHSILQSMISFPVPGGFLLSPLHESLLCLARKEKLSQNSKPVAAIKSGQEHAVALADDSASLMGDSKVPKDKKAKIVEKSDNLIVLKQELGMDFDDKRTTIVKREVDIEVRNVENESLDQKGCFSNDTKPKHISNSVCNVVDSVKGAAMAPGIPREAGRNISLKKREVTKDGMEDRLSTGLVKESESLSDQKGGKYEKAELRTRSSSMEKICESRLKNYHRNVSADLREAVQSKGNKVSDPLKADTDVSKCRRDHNVGAMDHSSYKVGQTTAYHEQVEAKMPHGMVKSSFEGKNKSKGSQSNGKSASEADESLMTRAYEVPKEKKKAAKMHNSKSQKDIQNVHDNRKDLLPKTRVEQMNNQINSLERPFGDKPKRSNPEAVEKEQCASLDKLKEISTRKKVDTQLTSETCLKEAANDVHPSAKGVTSEMEPTSVPLVVIEENWVLCDRCHKWRLLPDGTKPDQLPENWLCSMLNWLPGMNRCDISEEETTKALYALYQLPLPESQNNLEKHVDRTAAGASSADALHLNQNHLNLSSHGLLNPRKKKQGSKGTPCAASNGVPIQISGSTKNIQEEMVKCRSLNDMKQPILESNLMNNCSVEHLSQSRIIPMERNTHKQKEKHVNSGDAKQKRLKSKREADQYVYGTTKKIKADVAFGINKYGTTEPTGNIDKVGRGLPTKAAVRSTEKHNGHFYSKDAKSDWKEKVQISAKKREECASVSLHTGSLDMKKYDERELSLKKRKLKDWQESQNYVEASRDNGNHLTESKVFVKEESSDSEFRKAKKLKVSRTEGKQSSTSKGEDRLKTENKVTETFLSSGNRENPVHGWVEAGNVEKDQQPRKHKTKIASKPASDVVDSLKRDLGSEQFSRAATSSSSKVSDSRKSRVLIPEVKGSPVESVSSSPMRTSNLDKLSPARRHILGKDAGRNGDFPVMDSPRKSNGDGNIESNRYWEARREVCGVPHSEPLGFPVLDFQDNNSQKFGGKFKSRVKSPSEFQNGHLVRSDANNVENPCAGDLHASDHCNNENRMNKNHYHDNPEKSGKRSSLLSKDKDRISMNNFERVKAKVSDPPCEMDALNPKQSLRDEVEIGSRHVAPPPEEPSHLKCRIKPIKDDKSVGTKGSGKWESDNGRENQLEFVEHNSSAVKFGAHSLKDSRVTKTTPQQNLIQDFEGEVQKSDPTQVESRGGNSQAFPCHAGKQGPPAHVPHSAPRSLKGSAFDVIPVDSSGHGDLSEVLKQPKNAVNHLGHPVPNRRAVRDASSQVASNVLKEAEDLRDNADRYKGFGFGFECNLTYFLAALKFLHGASLLETCNGVSSKHGEMSQMQIYSDAAKLCEICAHEYEKRREMASAALAYKCMEVAYMRVVCCKNSSTNRDRHDLQASLQMAPQGESPSSSASDVDNLNNQAMVDKAALSKSIGAHAGNHAIVAHNCPNFVRLLDFTKDVNSAMDASRKSQDAFAAANVILEEAQNREVIISIKRVIDFSFQDIEELISLVRLAIEAISRHGFTGNKD